MQSLDVAKVCHEANRAYCIALGDNSQLPWDEAPDWQKQSAVKGVRYHRDNPHSTPADSHGSWLAEKQAAGWKYGPVEDADKKEHPCCLPYHELPKEQQKKDALFVAIVRALEE